MRKTGLSMRARLCPTLSRRPGGGLSSGAHDPLRRGIAVRNLSFAMKKPSELTVGLVAAVMAVVSAMWMDEANAEAQGAPDTTTQQAPKRKPRAAEVAKGTASEPSKPIDQNVSETAREADSKFREGYGGSGAAGQNDGQTDMKDVGRGAKKAEEATKQLGSDLKDGAKKADKGVRAGYHDEASNDAPRMTQDKRNDGSARSKSDVPPMPDAKSSDAKASKTEDDRTDMQDIGYELGKGARRLEEAANEAARKIRGEAKEVEQGYDEGYGGSGAGDGGTGKGSTDGAKDAKKDAAMMEDEAKHDAAAAKDSAKMKDRKSTGDGGTPGKVQIKLKTK